MKTIAQMTKEQQAIAAVAAKVANADELTAFFDRVLERMDLYEEPKPPVVEKRPKRH